MGYDIIERKELPYYEGFQTAYADLLDTAVAEAAKKWTEQSYGGFMPPGGTNAYGEAPIVPFIFADENDDILDENHVPTTWGVNEFRIYFSTTSPATGTVPGWRTILKGGNPQSIGQMPEDFIIGILGFTIPDPTIRFSHLKIDLGDVKYPKINIEGMEAYEVPTILLKKGIVVMDESAFELKGYLESTGYQRVIPEGFMLYRTRNQMVNV
ncbi:MAG: hypothetical protein ACXQS4_04610 [Methermicoccaceae archaeon]